MAKVRIGGGQRVRIGQRWHDEESGLECPRCGKKLMSRFELYRPPYALSPTEAPHRERSPYRIFCRFCPFKMNVGKRKHSKRTRRGWRRIIES